MIIRLHNYQTKDQDHAFILGVSRQADEPSLNDKPLPRHQCGVDATTGGLFPSEVTATPGRGTILSFLSFFYFLAYNIVFLFQRGQARVQVQMWIAQTQMVYLSWKASWLVIILVAYQSEPPRLHYLVQLWAGNGLIVWTCMDKVLLDMDWFYFIFLFFTTQYPAPLLKVR